MNTADAIVAAAAGLVSAGALYPFLGWRLSALLATAAIPTSSLAVVGNANGLRRFRPPASASQSAKPPGPAAARPVHDPVGAPAGGES